MLTRQQIINAVLPEARKIGAGDYGARMMAEAVADRLLVLLKQEEFRRINEGAEFQ